MFTSSLPKQGLHSPLSILTGFFKIAGADDEGFSTGAFEQITLLWTVHQRIQQHSVQIIGHNFRVRGTKQFSAKCMFIFKFSSMACNSVAGLFHGGYVDEYERSIFNPSPPDQRKMESQHTPVRMYVTIVLEVKVSNSVLLFWNT